MYCKKCNSNKPKSEFYIYNNKYQKPCKKCRVKKVLKYQENIDSEIKKERQRRYYRLRNPKKPPIPKWSQKMLAGINKRNKEKGNNINTKFFIDLFEEQNHKCYYTGITMIIDDPLRAPSPDRVDSSKGYTADNIVLCCRSINFAKSDVTEKEFKKFLVELKITNL